LIFYLCRKSWGGKGSLALYDEWQPLELVAGGELKERGRELI